MLVVGSFVGWPLAWWMMDKWLSAFAYRVELEPLPFLAGTAIAFGLAVVVVVSQSGAAAVRSPVDALRYE